MGADVMRAAWWMAMVVLACGGCSGGGGRAVDATGEAAVTADAVTDAAPDVATDAARDVPPVEPAFARHTVDAAAAGAAYATVADLDGDGRPEIIASLFGDLADNTVPGGEVVVYTRGADLDTWTRSAVLTAGEEIRFPNRVTVADVSGDGRPDLVLAAGFLVCPLMAPHKACGALLWWEQTDTGWSRHTLLTGSDYFYSQALPLDLDGDGRLDLVTVAERMAGNDRALARLFRGVDSPDRFLSTPVELGAGLGSFPTALDLDGDGDLDLAGAEFFVDGESAAWLENDGAAWPRHVILTDAGPAIQLSFVPDLQGDGVQRAVLANHVNDKDDPEGPVPSLLVLDVPADPTAPWPARVVANRYDVRKSEGFSFQQGPGVFGWGDLDGNGLIDLVQSGDGDLSVYWFQQTAPGTFQQHVLEASLGEASGAVVVDLDGNGSPEIVMTGYEDDKVYVYERQP